MSYQPRIQSEQKSSAAVSSPTSYSLPPIAPPMRTTSQSSLGPPAPLRSYSVSKAPPPPLSIHSMNDFPPLGGGGASASKPSPQVKTQSLASKAKEWNDQAVPAPKVADEYEEYTSISMVRSSSNFLSVTERKPAAATAPITVNVHTDRANTSAFDNEEVEEEEEEEEGPGTPEFGRFENALSKNDDEEW